MGGGGRRGNPQGEATKKPLKPVFLKCHVQNYAWGKRGDDSVVGRIFSLNSDSLIEDKPYAEIWIGTHDSGPSVVLDSECVLPLKEWLRRNPEALGPKVTERWGKDLPFLFKVLSVSKALSIQAHPDKQLASVLHKERPDIYRDSNHKPEMALALTSFDALCGFVDLQELKSVISCIPEIATLIGEKYLKQVLSFDCIDKDNAKTILSSVFTRLMSAEQRAVSETVSRMKSRLNSEKQVRVLTDKEQLALQLEEQYPNDVGILSSFFLNYVKLNPGEALCLDANEPHAYIHGDCIECMATSDNVVRAGLTPKFRDVETLCSMLTYKQGYPQILKGTKVSKYTKIYQPPFDEFEVEHCCLPVGETVTFASVEKPSVFIVIEGHGSMRSGMENENLLKEGDVFLLPANTVVDITSTIGVIYSTSRSNGNNGAKELQMYKASVNSKFV